MYIKFAVYIVSLVSSFLPTVCHASSDSFENSDMCVRKRKITDLDLKPEDSSSKKYKLVHEPAFIDPLPPEILVNIFSEVFLYDIIHCSQVCKAWYDAYRLLLTSSHVPLFYQYFLDHDECSEENRIIDISDQEFAINHLLLDDSILLEIHDHKTRNTSEPIYNSADFNNVLEKIADIILTKKGFPFCIEGIEQHYQLIQQWYRRTSAKFGIIANMNIGYMYEHGKGVQQDFGTACEWYKKACYKSKKNDKMHLPLIHYRLGRIYERWSHTRNIALSNDDSPNANDDIMNAKCYYQKAASQNHPGAKQRLNLLKTCEQYHYLFRENYDVYQLEFE